MPKPAHTADAERGKHQVDVSSPMHSLECGQIMIVDDNPANLKLLERILTEQGYQVGSFPSGKLALAAASQKAPGLILLDITMPEMNGYEICERLKADPKLAGVPVIFLSALSEVEDKIKAFHSGGVDYICKPFQVEEVRARVQTHLKLSELQKALRHQNVRLEQLVDQRTAELQLALKQIHATYEEMIAALGAALDLRDNETAGHSQRVTRYSIALAHALGCTQEEMKNIAMGAFLHDLGKIGIPDSILLKQGKLAPEEMKVMREHVRIGYDMVKK